MTLITTNEKKVLSQRSPRPQSWRWWKVKGTEKQHL